MIQSFANKWVLHARLLLRFLLLLSLIIKIENFHDDDSAQNGVVKMIFLYFRHYLFDFMKLNLKTFLKEASAIWTAWTSRREK